MTHTQELVNNLNKNVSKTQRRGSLTREMYIAKFEKIEHEIFVTESGIVAYKYVCQRDPALMLFTGKSNKPLIHGRFLSEESREKKIQTVISNIEHDITRKAERKIKQTQPSSLKVGSILYTSWGYEQTNIEFFEVVKTSGKRTVDLMRLHVSVTHGTYEDQVMPIPGSFITEGYASRENGTYRVKDGNVVSFNGYKNGWEWDGRSKGQTASGYGR